MLSTPRSVALDGRQSTPQELSDQAKWFTPGRVVDGAYVDGSVRWNLPKGDHTAKKAFWTSAECALACRGLAERYFHALLYEFQVNDQVFHPLKLHLIEYIFREKRLQQRDIDSAQSWLNHLKSRPTTGEQDLRRAAQDLKGAQQKSWPAEVQTLNGRKPYLIDLAVMNLIEIRNPGRFVADPKLPCVKTAAMDVRPDVWRRKLQPIYETIRGEYQRWVAIGVSHMRSRLYKP